MNTGVTAVTEEMELVSDPFNTLALGIYLALIFCLATPFFACCSYKLTYLRSYERYR